MNLAGFLSVTGITYYADSNGMMPENMPPDLIKTFQMLFFGGTMIAWIVAGVISVFFLFIKSNLRFLFLALPVLVPVAYASYILSIF